ncbi:aromatic ring-hydroxylating dioxygenase subunit alpha [Vineibacter terrae]|uniref:aromatic ring-hydroxylating oxygenase subunit alpha n=1 Tax=Vineibacter terrae TaxID=2586908 RepID=UPI002E35650D|nr:aromatic ring-hydroxylating dioxygenase subunit alpha [Vineibacter terrae]HEX2887739.1 aromatic ring-hydroxylating dioxygenase subunit alpha [Vineibacter terrae]
MNADIEKQKRALRDALPALEQPVAQAEGLPAFVYTDASWFEAERQALFAAGWMAVAFKSDVPEPGSLVPVEIAGWSLLVTRARDDTIRVFHNLCPHRGMKLAAAPKTQCSGLTCPWHAWTFDLAGKLLSTPNIGGPGVRTQDGFDRDGHGLREVRASVWLDVIFVNIDGRAPALDDYTRSFRQRLADFDFERTAQSDLAYEYDYACNWKIAIEGGIEDYHIPFVHPQLGPGGRFFAEYGDDRHVGIFCRRTVEDGKRRFLDVAQGAIKPLPAFPHVPDSGEVEASLIMLLFPNLFMATVLDHSTVSIIVPQDAGRTRYRRRFRLVEPAATGADYAATRARLLDGWISVTSQDGPVWGEVQRMMTQRAELGFRSAFSAHWESAIHEFQRKVAYKMLGETPPPRVREVRAAAE